jgi:hypothetical protein
MSAPAGVFRETLQRAGCLFQPASAMFQPASVHDAHTSGAVCVRCSLGGVAVSRAPNSGPFEAIGASSPTCISTLPRRPSAGRRVRFPQPPSTGSRIADSSSSCYRVIQVDAHAPFDKGWLVVRRLVHGSACAGLLGGARSRSLGTEGTELSLDGIPPTSCPR